MDNILHLNGLSVCMIVKNEEDFLENTLKAVQDIASEIIIVDTGSTDGTKEIASRFTNKIFDFEWVDDFSAARNFSLEKANYPLIMFIDADEQIVDYGEIKKIINSPDPNYGAWLVDLVSEINKKGKKEKFNTSLLRIIRNRPDYRFSGRIHEQIIEPINKSGLKIANSKVKIIHHGYDLEPEQMEKKQLRNLKLLEKSFKDDPNDAYIVYQLGKTYLGLKDKQKAVELLEKAIDLAEPNSATYPQALNFASLTNYQIGNINKSKEQAILSIDKVPDQSFANFIMGEIYADEGKHEKALDHYKVMKDAILNPSSKAKIMGDYNLPVEHVEFRIGRAFTGMGKYELGKEYFEAGLKLNPNDINNLIGLANYYVNKQNFEKCEDLLDKAELIHPNNSQVKAYLSQLDSIKKQIPSQNLVKKQMSEVDENPKDALSYLNMYKHRIISNTKKLDEIKKKKENNFIEIKNSLNKENPLLSLSMIVKNEEESLPGCLESAKDLVDEIVIVDTGSTDKTIEIAKQYGAKIYHFDWIDDFAAARNESLKHCTGEWILYLDADERVQSKEFDNIRNKLKHAEEDLGALICLIESKHGNIEGGNEVHRGGYPRLFRNLGYPKVYFRGRVHEQISPSLVEAGLGMTRSNILIEHIGYNISRPELEKKLKRNYKLLLQHVQEEPTNGYAWYQLGQTLGQMKLREKAEEAILLAIECGNLSDSVYSSSAATLSQFAGQNKDFHSALKWADESLKVAPEQVYGLNLKAQSLLLLGRKEEAKALFEKSLELLKAKKSVPLSGYDVMISEEEIKKGIQKAS